MQLVLWTTKTPAVTAPTHTSDDPQYQLFVNLKKKKEAVGMAIMDLSGIAWLQPAWLAPKAWMANVLKRNTLPNELNCSNPSQTADNHFGGKGGKVGGCSVLQKEANKLTEHQIGVRESSHEARMNFWASPASAAAFPSLATVPLRLLSMHTTSCASARKWSFWGYIYSKVLNCLSLERAEKLVYI
jgi:hypothetical protein